MRSARGVSMRVLFVHPSPLMYSEIYLRLEPLGMERVAAAVRAAGHEVRILDLQIFKHRDLFAELESFRPEVAHCTNGKKFLVVKGGRGGANARPVVRPLPTDI